MYTGTCIEDLTELVTRYIQKHGAENLIAKLDLEAARESPAMYLAGVLGHLANHRPMTEGDAYAWELVRIRQEQSWAEEVCQQP
jgi:hypothetical protein